MDKTVEQIKHRFSRRDFLRFVGLGLEGVVLVGCRLVNTPTPVEIKPQATQPISEETNDFLERIKSEVGRLAETYPEDSIVRSVYLAPNLKELSPIFGSPVSVGVADPRVTYARTYFTDISLTPNKRFSYFLERDASTADYSTVQSIKVAIFFSPLWLEARSDRVKRLALEKEALTVAQWRGFGQIALNTFKNQGRIDILDPNVTGTEIADTLATNLLSTNADVRKLFDYAPYLLLMERAEEILSSANQEEIQEINVTNFLTIYRMAKARGVSFEGIKFGSKEYWDLAFSPQSAWVKMILDPSLPGPGIITK